MKELPKKLVLMVLLVISISFLVLAVSASDSSSSKDTVAYSAEHAVAAEFTHDNDILYYRSSLYSIHTVPWIYHIDQNVESIAISSEGSHVAVGCDGGLIYLFDRQGNVVWNHQFGKTAIQSISFSEDGNYIDASNALNQAFYINLNGNLVDLPTTPAATVIPSATISPPPMIPTQTDFLSAIAGSSGFFGINYYLWVFLALIALGVLWVNISSHQKKGTARTYQTPPQKPMIQNDQWKKIRALLTLKNFTIVSIVFILIGLIPLIYPHNNYIDLFKGFFEIGVFCFILAYFLYAVKCWGALNQGCAFLMITIPLLVYFLTTSKIPESTTNILFYLFIQLCFYGIVAVILLYFSDKVKMAIERYLFQRTHRSHWHFTPKLSHAIIGVVVVSLLVINYGSFTFLSNNTNMVSQSIQRINSPAHTSSTSEIVPIQTASQSSRIVPTLQPEIIKSIESTVGNSAPIIDIPTLEIRVHELINQQRRNNGLSSLNYDSSLAPIARKHSADMARYNYFEHVNLQGLDPTDRGTQVGYSCYKNYGSYYTTGIAENIMQNNLYDSVTYYNGVPRYAWNSQEEIAQSTVDGWMNSPGHRQNILTSTYDREGIGVAIAANNKVYITQDFC